MHDDMDGAAWLAEREAAGNPYGLRDGLASAGIQQAVGEITRWLEVRPGARDYAADLFADIELLVPDAPPARRDRGERAADWLADFLAVRGNLEVWAQQCGLGSAWLRAQLPPELLVSRRT